MLLLKWELPRSETLWLRKLRIFTLNKTGMDVPGASQENRSMFWVFLNFLQSTHPRDFGLEFSEPNPQKVLTSMVCNAEQICDGMFYLMEKILGEHHTDHL